jgi:CRP-like cAMP-binding protein
MRAERRTLVDITERIIYLRSIPVAAELPPPILRIIASYLIERHFAPGEKLMRQDEPFSALQLLIEGRVALVRNGKPLGALAPPQSLGFLAILARGDGSYDATAETAVRSLELDRDAITELMEDHVELLHATLRYLGQRLLYEIQELPDDVMQSRLEGEDYPVGERELDLFERLIVLRALPGFSRANLSQLAQMANEMSERRFASGETIWAAGEPSRHSCIVVAGVGECVMGKRVWLAGPRSVLGGLEAIAGQPRRHGLAAKTRMVALLDPIDAFVGLLEDDFTMASGFVAMLAGELVRVLELKAGMGKGTLGVSRDVSRLGSVPVGA